MNTEDRSEFEFTNVDPSHNWKAGKKMTTRKSVDHTLRHGVRSMLRSASRRQDIDLPDLATIASLRDEVRIAEQAAVDTLRAKGHSWSEIAGALGCSKANVIQRFGHKVEVTV